MQLLSFIVVALAGAAIPAVFLYAAAYELRTGRSFSDGQRSAPLTEKGPIEVALAALLVLSNLALTAAGIAYFAEKIL